jgi:hypothetical protein
MPYFVQNIIGLISVLVVVLLSDYEATGVIMA